MEIDFLSSPVLTLRECPFLGDFFHSIVIILSIGTIKIRQNQMALTIYTHSSISQHSTKEKPSINDMIKYRLIILTQQMQALTAHLKRRNNKLLEQQLSLPRIPQVVNNQFNRTSIRVKKARPVIKYVSETTFSPQQQHIHQQLKMALQKPETSAVSESSRILQLLKGAEPIRQKKILPKIKQNNAPVSRIESPEHKASRHLSSRRKSKSVNHTKVNLTNIFRDPNEFIKSYFADINDRLKR